MPTSVIEFVLAGFSVITTLLAGFFALQSKKHKSNLEFAKKSTAQEQARADTAEIQRDAATKEAVLLNAVNEEASRLNTQQKEALDEIHKRPVDRDAFDNNG